MSVLYSEFGPIWRKFLPYEKDPTLKLVIPKIRKYPYIKN